ncbi:MAG: IclR family transcriptional regulator [Proteobacteria bacterium]|nr:IclR family transcriptional regulator [Pseudomonadota bacterium]
MKIVRGSDTAGVAETGGDTPALRLLSLLEVIAAKDQLPTLQSLVEATGWPKPTLHRMLQQLEGAGLLLRDGDGRHYAIGARLKQLAENLLLNDSHGGARHAVLRQLVEEVGESCNLTALSGSEVIYLDRVETAAPLRFYLHPGSRVPAHCSASGKVLLAQLPPAQRQRLLGAAPLTAYTPHTITDPAGLEEEFKRIRRDGHGFDNEEFLPGLMCLAVQVSNGSGRSNLCVALQGPTVRLNRDKALQLLPALQRAADALARIHVDAGNGLKKTSA